MIKVKVKIKERIKFNSNSKLTQNILTKYATCVWLRG